MIGLHPGIARRLRIVAVTATVGLLAVACGSASAASNADGTTSTPSSASSPATGADGAAPQAGPSASTADCDSVTTCYTPQQLQVAYGIKPLLDRGIDGRGETVVFPELAETQLRPPLVTDLRQDMAGFDRLFHLPAARMRVVSTLVGGPASPWLAFGEEVLDVEMVHALAPGANLVILLVPSTSLNNTANAAAAAVASLRLGSSLGGIMSVSAAGQVAGEHCISRAQADSVNAALQQAVSRHVTVVAASGDAGVVGEGCAVIDPLTGTGTFIPVRDVNLLASDPLVLGVGGTSLTASHTTGAWISETAWAFPTETPGRRSRPRAAGSAACSPVLPTRTACPSSGPPAGYPTCPPTPAATSGWPLSSATAPGPWSATAAAPVPAPRSGPR